MASFYLMLTLVTIWMLKCTCGQMIFKNEELGDLLKQFNDSRCDGKQNENQEDMRYYRYLQKSDKDPDALYIGAMNNVYKVKFSDMSCLKYNESRPDNNTIRRCYIQGKQKVPECQNHIRVVLEDKKNRLLVCGTGGYSPVRYYLNNELDDLEINETFNGVAYCPFDPFDNYTAILISQGNPGNATVPYFGTYTDFIKSSPVFYRPKYEVTSETGTISYTEKTTDREDIGWFNSPQFVGSFDNDEKVTFFFRETPIETSVRNKVYSRVGKVCKQDLGGGYMDVTKKKWLSFQKARLICSLPGEQPYYFDDIYDVYESGDQFFALFYKPNKEHAVDSFASAICVYNKEDIETVFAGKFQYRASNGVWQTVPDSNNPNPRLDNCTAHRDNPDIFSNKVSQYQLMAGSVHPAYGRPIFYKADVQFINIAVSDVKTQAETTGRNIYLATDEGEVYDIFLKTLPDNKFIVEQNPTIYLPFGSVKDKKFTIWNMKLLDNALVLGTDYQVKRFNIKDICDKIGTINICIKNSLCKWNKCKGTCEKHDAAIDVNCATINWSSITSEDSIISIKEDLQDPDETLKIIQSDAGLYATIPFKSKVFAEDVVWLRSTDCTGNSVLENSEKYAISNSKDLIVKNMTDSDNNAHFCICYNAPEKLKLKGYKVTVITENAAIIDAWKQQFNDWSSAFSKWKDCSQSYFDSCDAR